MLTFMSGTAICSETVNARNERRPKGTIMSSTRGTRIIFAGIETRGITPNDSMSRRRVVNVAAQVVFMRVMALSLSVPNLCG